MVFSVSLPMVLVSDAEVLSSLPEEIANDLSPVAKKSKIQACVADAPPHAIFDWFCFSSENSSMKNGRKSGWS